MADSGGASTGSDDDVEFDDDEGSSFVGTAGTPSVILDVRCVVQFSMVVNSYRPHRPRWT